jgi:hypothetical protein
MRSWEFGSFLRQPTHGAAKVPKLLVQYLGSPRIHLIAKVVAVVPETGKRGGIAPTAIDAVGAPAIGAKV